MIVFLEIIALHFCLFTSCSFFFLSIVCQGHSISPIVHHCITNIKCITKSWSSENNLDQIIKRVFIGGRVCTHSNIFPNKKTHVFLKEQSWIFSPFRGEKREKTKPVSWSVMNLTYILWLFIFVFVFLYDQYLRFFLTNSLNLPMCWKVFMANWLE